MSYRVKAYILSDIKFIDVFGWILRINKSIKEDSLNILAENFNNRPSLFKEVYFDDIDKFFENKSYLLENDKWLESIFTVNYYYLPKRQILLFWPNCSYTTDKYANIIFQNAIDQDYKRDCYKNIPMALEIFDMSCKINNNYENRTHAYQIIEEKLKIKEMINNQVNKDIHKLSVNVLDNNELAVIRRELNEKITKEFI